MGAQSTVEVGGARAPPSEAPLSTRSLVLVTIGLMASAFAGFVDQTIVSTAGPTIISALGGLSLYAWVYSAFLIAATASMPIFGKLSDRYGRKRFFILGSVIFIGGSVLSGLSQSIYQLIAFRAIQGLGAGALVPILFGLVGTTFPRSIAPRVQGLLFAMVGLATVIGPTIGSYLVEYAGWRWVFYFNLPIGILSILLVFVGLKESRRPGPRLPIDSAGILSLLGWSVLLMFGLLDGGSTFPWYSWQEVATFGAAALFFVVFAFVEGRAKDPVVPPSLLRIRTVTASLSVGLLRQTTFFAAIIYVPLLVQAGLGGSVADGRNALYALALPFIAGSLLSGQAITRGVGYRGMVLSGLAAMLLGTFSLTFVRSTSSLVLVMGAVVPVGLGAGLTISATLSAVQNSVERKQIGTATSLLTFMLFLGSSVGIAIIGSIQANAFSARLAALLPQVPLQARGQVAALLANPNIVGNMLSTPQALAQAIAEHPALAVVVPQLREAFSLSFAPIFWFVAALMVAGMVLGALISTPNVPPPKPEKPAQSLKENQGERLGPGAAL